MTALRAAGEADVPAVLALLADPGVRRWWGDMPEAEIREQLGAAFVVLVDDEIAGWLQYEEETHFQYPSVEFDIAVADRFAGRGVGPEALRLAVADFGARGHHRFIIAPAAANHTAVRAYEKAGFTPVGVMRKASRLRRGDPFEDDLLMERVIG